jgi:hypothetical protein
VVNAAVATTLNAMISLVGLGKWTKSDPEILSGFLHLLTAID